MPLRVSHLSLLGKKRFYRVLGVMIAWVGFGCSHYYLPGNHLDSPEASGAGRVGRLEPLALISGPNLTDPAVTPPPDEESGITSEPELQNSWVHPVFGFTAAASDEIDVGIRIQPTAPLSVRVKYQFTGLPESKSVPGNFSAAIIPQAGILLGPSSAAGTSSVTYFMGDVALIGGYRLWRNHLFTLGPFFSFANLSGVTLSSAISTSGKNSGTSGLTSGSAVQYGAGLGYQYQLESLILAAEFSYNRGSFNSAQIKGYYLGALLGINL